MSLTTQARFDIRKESILNIIHKDPISPWAKSFWLKTYIKLLEEHWNEAKVLSRRSN